MTKPEAIGQRARQSQQAMIERLAKWAQANNAGVTYMDARTYREPDWLGWAANFYAGSLRDMTAAILMNSDSRNWLKDRVGEDATNQTHALIERLTSE